MSKNLETLTRQFLAVRKYKTELSDRQKACMAVVNAQMHEIEMQMHALMHEQGLQSAPNQYGTPYLSTLNSFPVKDWDAFISYVQENDLWHMLERRVAKSAVEEFAEGNGGNVPPGLGRKSVINIRVRSK